MKKIIIVIGVICAILFFSGFSWGGVGNMPMSMRQDNHINYFPRAVFSPTGEYLCILLPFERYYSDGYRVAINGVVSRGMIAVNSGRCYGVAR